jgi:transcriptional regulator with XRE-family HTH domain
MSESFGSYIRTLRIAQGKSLQQVQNETGISGAYINRMENNTRRCCSIPIIEGLAKCYDRPICEMVDMAIGRNCETEKKQLFFTIIYGHDFVLAGREVTIEIKDSLYHLINYVANCEWSDESKIKDSLTIMTKVEELKKALIS